MKKLRLTLTITTVIESRNNISRQHYTLFLITKDPPPGPQATELSQDVRLGKNCRPLSKEHMTAAEMDFPQFAQLPKEIRYMIWDIIMQQNHESQPLAHFASFGTDWLHRSATWRRTYPRRHQGPSSAIQPDQMDPDDDATARHQPYWEGGWRTRIKLPHWWDSLLQKWTWQHPSNHSAYMTSWRPWHTCYESMESMKRNLHMGTLHALGEHETGKVLALGISEDGGAPQRPIIINAMQDLIIIGLPKALTCPVGNEIALAIPRDTIFHRNGVRIGLDFDPRWIQQLNDYELGQSEPADGLPIRQVSSFFNLLDTSDIDHLEASDIDLLDKQLRTLGSTHAYFSDPRPIVWFLDYESIRPKANISYANLVKNRKVFRAKGQRYVQVFLSDLENRWTFAQGKTKNDTAVDFCRRFCVYRRRNDCVRCRKIRSIHHICSRCNRYPMILHVASCIPDCVAESLA